MIDFKKAMGRLSDWERLRTMDGLGQFGTAALDSPLKEMHSAGPNPGNLRMFAYVPDDLADNPALVVVLHGCTQTASGYDYGAGWSTLADRYGFALLVPEQQRSNNPNGCFNWFLPEDTQRGRGEAASTRDMVETMVREKGIDPRRVFITGLSAGGAMTSVMLACYPEVFAGGAIVAGLPYGAASNVQQAFESMLQCPSRPAREWGGLVRGAAHHDGPWPRVSVWHGSADKTVIPSNAREILKQWTDVHGVQIAPSGQETVDGYPRQVWVSAAGEEVIESYTIPQMPHGTPLATGKADFECGAAGPFLLDVGISSSFHIAKFFGLTTAGVRSASPTREHAASALVRLPADSPADSAQSEILYGEVLDDAAPEYPRHSPASPRIDIRAVITKALEAAGLMRGK
jgi:poly(hydroxyalkanoate) depolymerase family esterase